MVMDLSKAYAIKRQALESLYTGKCTIYEYKKIKKANKSTGFEEVAVLADQACRLSFKQSPNTSGSDDLSSGVMQTIELFISPDVKISPGSKIVVTQNGRTTEYADSGVPVLYPTHQAINLKLFKGWS